MESISNKNTYYGFGARLEMQRVAHGRECVAVAKTNPAKTNTVLTAPTLVVQQVPTPTPS